MATTSRSSSDRAAFVRCRRDELSAARVLVSIVERSSSLGQVGVARPIATPAPSRSSRDRAAFVRQYPCGTLQPARVGLDRRAAEQPSSALTPSRFIGSMSKSCFRYRAASHRRRGHALSLPRDHGLAPFARDGLQRAWRQASFHLNSHPRTSVRARRRCEGCRACAKVYRFVTSLSGFRWPTDLALSYVSTVGQSRNRAAFVRARQRKGADREIQVSNHGGG